MPCSRCSSTMLARCLPRRATVWDLALARYRRLGRLQRRDRTGAARADPRPARAARHPGTLARGGEESADGPGARPESATSTLRKRSSPPASILEAGLRGVGAPRGATPHWSESRAAIESEGTTVRDYRTGTGKWAASSSLMVYDREGEPCLRCGHPRRNSRHRRADHCLLPPLSGGLQEPGVSEPGSPHAWPRAAASWHGSRRPQAPGKTLASSARHLLHADASGRVLYVGSCGSAPDS
jgi:hypothetical protein